MAQRLHAGDENPKSGGTRASSPCAGGRAAAGLSGEKGAAFLDQHPTANRSPEPVTAPFALSEVEG